MTHRQRKTDREKSRTLTLWKDLQPDIDIVTHEQIYTGETPSFSVWQGLPSTSFSQHAQDDSHSRKHYSTPRGLTSQGACTKETSFKCSKMEIPLRGWHA